MHAGSSPSASFRGRAGTATAASVHRALWVGTVLWFQFLPPRGPSGLGGDSLSPLKFWTDNTSLVQGGKRNPANPEPDS